ncbi:MAG: IclR family transcriptional regulator [Pseudomonadota bacterium]
MLLTVKHSNRHAGGLTGGAPAGKDRIRKPQRLRGGGQPQGPGIRVVVRAPNSIAARAVPIEDGNIIAPIERGLAILAAFGPADPWLGNQEIAARTGIPKPTVTRLTQTLTEEGFLHHSPGLRKYRLAAAVLALGYVTMDNSDIAAIARPLMQKLADECGMFVSLAGRDSLDISLVENCHSATAVMTLGLNPGARFPIASSPFGLALLSGLPDAERSYLLDHIRLRYEQEYRISLRSHVADAVTQVTQKGYCVSDWGSEIIVAAAPLNIPERPPMAIGCAGPAKFVTREKLREQIGPKLTELVATLQAHASLLTG